MLKTFLTMFDRIIMLDIMEFELSPTLTTSACVRFHVLNKNEKW